MAQSVNIRTPSRRLVGRLSPTQEFAAEITPGNWRTKIQDPNQFTVRSVWLGRHDKNEGTEASRCPLTHPLLFWPNPTLPRIRFSADLRMPWFNHCPLRFARRP